MKDGKSFDIKIQNSVFKICKNVAKMTWAFGILVTTE